MLSLREVQVKRHVDSDIRIGRIPSLKSACPRAGCRQQMRVSILDSGVVEESCPEGHYTARTVTGESRYAWHEAVSTKIRIGRSR